MVTSLVAAGNLQTETGLGGRLRELRSAAGLTQTELAGGRFSKEYVSQIERGKTQPTGATLRWLAERLGVDPAFLAGGISTADRDRLEATLVRAEAASEAHREDEAIAAFEQVRRDAPGVADLEFRALIGEAWSRIALGEVAAAIEQLNEARSLVGRPQFSDVDRAD